MKKITFSLFFFVLICSQFSCDKNESTDNNDFESNNDTIINLILNGDFEEITNSKPNNWNLNNENISVSTEKSKSGTNSILIDLSEYYASESGFSQEFANKKLIKDEKYTISAWIYAEYLNETSEFGISFGADYELAHISVNETQSDWQYYSVDFIAYGEKPYRLFFQVLNYFDEEKEDYYYKVWVDNLELVKVE